MDGPDIRLALAQAYVRMSRPKDALKASLAAVAASPNSGPAHLALSAAYAQQFDTMRANAELATAERLDPTNVDAYLVGAEYYKAANDAEQTEAQARKCISIAPNLAEAWYLVGWSLEARPTPDNLNHATDAFRHAIQLDPRALNSWLELGSVLLQTRQPAAAIPDLEKANMIEATLTPGERKSQKQLQERIRIDHLLLEAYGSGGSSKKIASIEDEIDRLSALVQEMQRKPAT